MKRSRYINLLAQAKIDSVEKRWKLLRDFEWSAPNPEIIDCPFCDIWRGLEAECDRVCPFVRCKGEGSLYYAWAEAEAGTPEERAAAQAIIDFIESIDVEAWADTLVERGVLKP